MTENNRIQFAVILKLLSARFSRYLDDKTSDIDHKAVISDLAKRTEINGSYLSSLILANLIALLGLLTNSVAVVIGAMLISPLMGPIFSLGLGFTMGDLVLSRRAVRNIVFSILLAVTVAAIFTLFSPLKGITHEILSRTHPNIYDLLIAVFAGTAGALAICTRKNYLFTTTGVAVATAVIPPLSVVGYGIGTWQFELAIGGFLLFFTNLVAIVISSNVIFYVLRFRGSMVAESRYPLRRRFQILGSVLVIISIPLVITLVTDLRKVKLTGQVESVLKGYLNKQHLSRVTDVAIDYKSKQLIVIASINTVTYVGSEILHQIEVDLNSKIGKPIKLELEQVIVRSGAVDPTPTIRTVLPAAKPIPETLITLREKAIGRIREGCRELETFIAPYKVNDCSVTFSDQNKQIYVTVSIARDFPPNQQEISWFKTVLEKKLAEAVELKILTVPLMPPIVFTDKNEMDTHSIKAMVSIKQLLIDWPASELTIVKPFASRQGAPTTQKHVSELKKFLTKELAITEKQIFLAQGDEKVMRVKVVFKK